MLLSAECGYVQWPFDGVARVRATRIPVFIPDTHAGRS